MNNAVKVTEPLFAFDVILPVQFFSPRHQLLGKVGEYRLLIAILEDALACFQRYAGGKSRRERRLFKEAEGWIMLADNRHARPGDDTAPAFSFEYVCDVLGIAPDPLRQRLRRWREAQPTTAKPGVTG